MIAEFGADAVRAAFLAAPDTTFFHRAITDDVDLDPSEHESALTQARMNALYGDWLAAEANRLGLPVVPALPWDLLLARLLAVG